jgi:hypothetical protein
VLTIWARKEDYSITESWRLVEWCLERGAREFTLSFIGPSDLPRERWNDFDIPLAPFALDGSRANRFVLTPGSIAVLRNLFADGLFTHDPTASFWLEDPVLLKEGRPILRVISHEGEAMLSLSQRIRRVSMPQSLSTGTEVDGSENLLADAA